jgi:hypothetical protein
MKKALIVLSVTILSVGLSAQQRTPRAVVSDLEALIAELKTVLPSAPDPVIQVPADGNLQTYLNDAGGKTLWLAAGATYTGGFTVPSHVKIWGEGAHLVGVGKPALRVPAGVTDVVVENLRGTSNWASVFAVGDNADRDPALVPRHITFRNVHVPTHRGRRGFELHGADIRLLGSSTRDVWGPALCDSQGVWINNGPGPYLISGGHYEGGSENIMVGGAPTGIPGLIPADITVEDATLQKPASWRTDGINRCVKTIFELKTGERVTLRRVTLDGAWRAAQDGWALTFTPRSGGAIRDVLIEQVVVTNAEGAINVMGENNAPPATPFRTTGIRVWDSVFQVAHTGGRGLYALMTRGVGTFDSSNVVFVGTGNALITVGDAIPVERLSYVGGFATVGQYGLFVAAKGSVGEKSITGNTFSGISAGAPAAFRSQFAENKFVERSELDALIAPKLRN